MPINAFTVSKFAWSDQNSFTSLHDRPFTCITMSRIARKQGLEQVADHLLSGLTDGAVDVEFAFLKLREQVIGYQKSSSEGMLRAGLNLVNSTNLSFFNPPQKAEMFRLKGAFFNGMLYYCGSIFTGWFVSLSPPLTYIPFYQL